LSFVIFGTGLFFEIMTASTDVSDYERLRASNIQRNNARLRALGLLSFKEEEESNALAFSFGSIRSKKKNESSSPSAWSSNIQKRKRLPVAPTESRKSLRLQGKHPDGVELVAASPGSREKERQARVQECRAVRLQLARDFANLTDAERKAAKENSTASYEHASMRIRTMTDKALANRVKAIERAAGKHSVVKMALFKSCLQDYGKWELAELASQSLERLKALN
jgi:hypothetical protein